MRQVISTTRPSTAEDPSPTVIQSPGAKGTEACRTMPEKKLPRVSWRARPRTMEMTAEPASTEETSTLEGPVEVAGEEKEGEDGKDDLVDEAGEAGAAAAGQERDDDQTVEETEGDQEEDGHKRFVDGEGEQIGRIDHPAGMEANSVA